MLLPFFLVYIICLILVNGLSALSLPNYQCVASEGKVISEFLKASYVLDSITVENDSSNFLGTVRIISAMEYFDFYFPVSPKYDFSANYNFYRSWQDNSAHYYIKNTAVIIPSFYLCLRACSENPSCKSLIYNRNQTECHILRDNKFISHEVNVKKKLQISSFDRKMDLVEPKELYFASKKCLSRSQVVECKEPKWIFNKYLDDMFSIYPNHLIPPFKKLTYEILNHICMEKGVQHCMENQTSSFNCNLIIENDGDDCTLPRESTIFTSKCNNGSTIETRIHKRIPEIGDSITFENGKLTLPACSTLVRQNCITIGLSVWYWVLPVVIVLLFLVGAVLLWLRPWYCRKKGRTNIRGGNQPDSMIRRLAQRYLSPENRMHQLSTPQIRDDINDRLSSVLPDNSLSTENQDVIIGRDDPPSYSEVFRDGLNHAGDEPPPEYQSPVPDENNQGNPFMYKSL